MALIKLLFALSVYVCSVVNNIHGAPVLQPQLVLARWNNIYCRLFEKISSDKLEDGALKFMTVKDAVEAMEELRKMISVENASASDIPKIEADKVRFWSKSFEPLDCSINRDQQFREEYKREIDNHSGGQLRVAPNLETYLDYTLETLLYYCMAVQDEAILMPINATKFSKLQSIVGSFGTEDNPPKLIPKQIVKYLIKHNNETTNDLDETKRIYKRILTELCTDIEELDDAAKDAIRYLEWQDVLVRADLIVQEWYRSDRICQQITTWLNRLTGKTVVGRQTN